eukprot:GHRR01009124.1.p1 GENE.GHRR01009124.1~~GHRR01009124.1.p1  ORF type:complete len:569 (+),score=138.88 GHRR01009124.1:238-1944(+)
MQVVSQGSSSCTANKPQHRVDKGSAPTGSSLLPRLAATTRRPLPRQFPSIPAQKNISTIAMAQRDELWAFSSDKDLNTVASHSATTIKRPAIVEEHSTDALTGLIIASPTKKARTVGDTTAGAVAGYSPELTKALKSVVKIFTTMASPNFGQPWQMHQQTKCTATGFVVAPLGSRRILTNAHAVANQVAVKVRKHGNAQRYSARVLAVGHECDIAMLTVDDDEFWEDVQPLEINGLPAMQESVMVVGFPTGGDNVCVTKGVVSRIDRSNYSHGRTTLLAIQVDAAINSGNSGGPVLLGDHVVGIAFQCLTSGENIGYIIPVPVINHFLEDLERNGGKYTGFCELGVSWQSMENPDMKLALGMPRGMTGVYITKTEPMYDASSKLRAGDVLTHFNGVEIADDGTFLFREAVRINFGHLVSQAFHGDEATCKVWRDGQHLTLPVVLSTPHQLVPVHSHDVKPSYFIYAGLVFTPLTSWYLRSVYGADWSCKAPIKLVEKAFAASMKQTGEEVVVLSKVLASDINAGYQDIANIQVLSVNGQKVANLAHLAYLIKTCQDKFVKLQLEWSKV